MICAQKIAPSLPSPGARRCLAPDVVEDLNRRPSIQGAAPLGASALESAGVSLSAGYPPLTTTLGPTRILFQHHRRDPLLRDLPSDADDDQFGLC